MFEDAFEGIKFSIQFNVQSVVGVSIHSLTMEIIPQQFQRENIIGGEDDKASTVFECALLRVLYEGVGHKSVTGNYSKGVTLTNGERQNILGFHALKTFLSDTVRTLVAGTAQHLQIAEVAVMPRAPVVNVVHLNVVTRTAAIADSATRLNFSLA